MPTTKDANKPYWPYWYIHNKLYDLTPWLEKHPGGKEFLLHCQGTDCTAAFETHHIRMPKAQAMLSKFEVVTDEPIVESPWPQYNWSQYQTLRSRIAARLKAENWQPGPMRRGKIIALGLFALNISLPFAWPFLWQNLGPFALLFGLVYAMNIIIMTGFGHMFLHLNTKWQYLGDLGGFSSFSWKSEHCLEHHMYTNHPKYDPDVTKFSPILRFAPNIRPKWQKFAPIFIAPLYAISFMLIRLSRPFEIVKNPSQWRTRLCWYLVGSYGWLTLWAVTGYFWVGLLLECVASFLFLSLTLSNHNHQACFENVADHEHNKQLGDFVSHQMQGCYDFGSHHYWSSMIFSAFLGSQTLHHLFPTIDPTYFRIVEQELNKLGYSYERRSFWFSFVDHIKFVSNATRK